MHINSHPKVFTTHKHTNTHSVRPIYRINAKQDDAKALSLQPLSYTTLYRWKMSLVGILCRFIRIVRNSSINRCACTHTISGISVIIIVIRPLWACGFIHKPLDHAQNDRNRHRPRYMLLWDDVYLFLPRIRVDSRKKWEKWKKKRSMDLLLNILDKSFIHHTST